MDKETIKSYLNNISNLMYEGKFIAANSELQFVLKNIEIKEDKK